MATAAEKKTITKKLLQELRNRCRDHYNVVADGTMPEAVDVRETNQKISLYRQGTIAGACRGPVRTTASGRPL